MNYLDPTAAEIRQWAFGPDSLYEEDLDILLTGKGFEDLFLELVEDADFPKADFFLHCLYLWVYDTVRVHGRTDELERLLGRGEASAEPVLRQWARRSRALIANPKRAERHIWWGFGQKRESAQGGEQR
jgi:hypothetical protein